MDVVNTPANDVAGTFEYTQPPLLAPGSPFIRQLYWSLRNKVSELTTPPAQFKGSIEFSEENLSLSLLFGSKGKT